MKAIVSACQSGEIGADVVIVVSNRLEAPGIEWANHHGLETAVIPHRGYSCREDHDAAVVTRLREAAVDWVCLAGYMRLLSPLFIAAFPGRILNIHPSLLPAFPGLNAQHQALEYGVRVTGCTVHLVDTELDHGPIIEQRTIEVRDSDTGESLSKRLIVEEHRCYVQALGKLLSGRYTVKGRRLRFD